MFPLYSKYAQKVISEMVIKVIQTNALQEATQIVRRYQGMHAGVQHWTCEVCGMIHTGSVPTSCDSCGVVNAFMPQQEMRNEIGSRW